MRFLLGLVVALLLVTGCKGVQSDPVEDCMSDNAQYVDGLFIDPDEYADLEAMCDDLYGGDR